MKSLLLTACLMLGLTAFANSAPIVFTNQSTCHVTVCVTYLVTTEMRLQNPENGQWFTTSVSTEVTECVSIPPTGSHTFDDAFNTNPNATSIDFVSVNVDDGTNNTTAYAGVYWTPWDTSNGDGCVGANYRIIIDAAGTIGLAFP